MIRSTLALALLLTCYASHAARSTPVQVMNDATTPVPVTVENVASNPQFVGFTTATFDGGQGFVTYTNACQAEFTGSHMCTSEEFLNSTSFPATSGGGWIRPTYKPIANASSNTGDNSMVLDASGVKAPDGTMSCDGWRQNATYYYGLNVDFSGKFRRSSCFTSSSVACCQ